MRRLYFFAVIIAALALAGCSPRVSCSVGSLYVDPKFSGRMLSGAPIALLPLLGAHGAVMREEFGARETAAALGKLRPDLEWAPYGDFESGFPARFDTRELDKFYKGIFNGEVLAVKEMDSVWRYVRHPYILAFSLVDGASIRNMDESEFKHVSLRCELWSRDGREAVWRIAGKAVTDDGGIPGKRLISESMRRIAEEIPGAGGKNW